MRLAPAILVAMLSAACSPPAAELTPKSARDHVPLKLVPRYARSKYANKRARKTSHRRKRKR